MLTDAERKERNRRERLRFQGLWPAEFKDGVRCGLLREPDEAAPRERSGYPKGFHGWPLERRNAWYCGFNVGYTQRKAIEAEEDSQ